jgi:hypothetical protein
MLTLIGAEPKWEKKEGERYDMAILMVNNEKTTQPTFEKIEAT